MDLIRIWQEVNISDITENIVLVDDKFGHCPNCKKIGIELKDLTHCPSCNREFKYVSSKEAVSGKHDIVTRSLKKLPNMKFVDYNDYEHAVSKDKLGTLFKKKD
jgi:uncharacterized protein with PIN domain